MDRLDIALIEILTEHPRAGVLELARRAGVARATVSARLSRLEASGVVTGYAPQLDLVAAGYPVQAFVTLEIAQGRLDEVRQHLESLPGAIEAYAITGTGDVLCRLAAASNDELQELLLGLDRSPAVRRSTSVIVLSTVVAPRVLPLLNAATRPAPRRSRGFGASPGTGRSLPG